MDLAADVYTLPRFDFRCLQESRERFVTAFILAEVTAGIFLIVVGCTLCCTGSGSLSLFLFAGSLPDGSLFFYTFFCLLGVYRL